MSPSEAALEGKVEGGDASRVLACAESPYAATPTILA